MNAEIMLSLARSDGTLCSQARPRQRSSSWNSQAGHIDNHQTRSAYLSDTRRFLG
jgi:hypothetical protein